MGAHRCHARECGFAVPPEKLMCLRHWRMVPGRIKAEVLRTYRLGQCDDKKPSREWHTAASAAIGYVARREKHLLTVAETFALIEFDYWPENLSGLAALMGMRLRRNSKVIEIGSVEPLIADARLAAKVLDKLAKELG